MQIAKENINAEVNQIRAYRDGSIQVNNETYHESIIIVPRGIVKTWDLQDYRMLEREHLSFIEEYKPQLVLFGTGKKMLLPPLEIRLALQKMGIGIEFMDTAAACRTYNVLVAEDRNVAAALIIAQ